MITKLLKLALLCSILLINIDSFAQNNHNLKGKVKTFLEFDIEEYENGTGTLYEFDKNGNERLWERYSYGELRDKKTYVFNEKGLKLKEVVYNVRDGEPLITRTYKYDNYGNLVETDYDGKIEKYDLKINRDGKIMESSHPVYGNNKYTYDSRGNQTEDFSYQNGKVTWKRLYAYDSRNNKIEKILYYEDELRSKDTYTYDSKNNKTADITYRDKMIKYTTLYEYDENNNEVVKADYDGDLKKLNSKYRTTYEYDTYGNWIKQNTLKDGSTDNAKVYARIIEYYDE